MWDVGSRVRLDFLRALRRARRAVSGSGEEGMVGGWCGVEVVLRWVDCSWAGGLPDRWAYLVREELGYSGGGGGNSGKKSVLRGCGGGQLPQGT